VSLSEDDLDLLEQRIDGWLATQLQENPIMVALDRGEPGERRWYVRLVGEEKDFTTIWFTLRQRTLHYETYVMPAPEENHEQFWEHLLRRNYGLYGVHFAIGPEDAVFLVGHVPADRIFEDDLDRIVGTVYASVEQFFRPALRIGYASRFG
jgi:hypothetical protein